MKNSRLCLLYKSQKFTLMMVVFRRTFTIEFSWYRIRPLIYIVNIYFIYIVNIIFQYHLLSHGWRTANSGLTSTNLEPERQSKKIHSHEILKEFPLKK